MAAAHDERALKQPSWNGLACLRPMPDQCPVWCVVLLCFVSVLIGVVVRYAWIDWAGQYEQFTWNGRLQPTTQDSFFHGSAIRHHAEGALQGILDRLPLLNRQGAIHLIGIGARVLLPVSTDDILLWSPVFLGSLLAIPVVLIGRRLGSTWMGFGAAILSVVAVNYYERSMAGYYDHDMLAFTAAAFVAWLLMEIDARSNRGWLLAGALSIFLYPLIYANGVVIITAMVLTWAALRVLLYRRQPETPAVLFVALLAAIVSPLSTGDHIEAKPLAWGASFAAIVLAWWWMTTRPPRKGVIIMLCLAGLLAALLVFPWDRVLGQLQSHLKLEAVRLPGAESYAQISLRDALKGTILETQLVSAGELGSRLIGSPLVAIIAIIGLVALCLAVPAAMVLVPFACVAAFAIPGGLRFTTWGTVPAALGASFVAFLAVRWLTAAWAAPARKPAAIIAGLTLCGLMAWPSVAHDLNFRVSTIFIRPEIAAFQAIREQSRPDDLVLAWWDYGSGIRYYAERAMLADPGHVSADAVAISRILTSDSQQEAARLSLALAQAIVDGKHPGGSLSRLSRIPREVPSSGLAESMTAAEAIEQLIRSRPDRLSNDSDVWIYMPLHELLILPSIAKFSPVPLHEGEAAAKPILVGFYRDLQPGPQGWMVSPQAKMAVNQESQPGLLEPDGRITPVRFASVTSVGGTDSGVTQLRRSAGGTTGPWVKTFEGRMVASPTRPDADSSLHLVIIPKANAMLIANEAAMRTNAIQMGLLGLIDRSLFEQVYANPHARVLRVRQAGEHEGASGS